ncbi:Tar-like ligand binding protein [Paraburkholderia sp. RAU2J]|nr:Tar-like ligand binding protein [Paraburkholderia sp. RAU2J]
MFRNTTIRTALAVTIAGYAAALVFVIAAAVGGLKTVNAALEKMYSEETVALRHLTASHADGQCDPARMPRWSSRPRGGGVARRSGGRA